MSLYKESTYDRLNQDGEYEERLSFLNSPAMVSITKDIVKTLNELKERSMKKKTQKFCSKHNQLEDELWEGQFQCASCYEDYILNKDSSFEMNMSDEYYQSVKDSE